LPLVDKKGGCSRVNSRRQRGKKRGGTGLRRLTSKGREARGKYAQEQDETVSRLVAKGTNGGLPQRIP